MMDADDETRLREELERLRQKHRELADTIDRLAATDRIDPVQLQLLKKQKLALKDRIAEVENRLLPDIIA
jgi:hypothetical protein